MMVQGAFQAGASVLTNTTGNEDGASCYTKQGLAAEHRLLAIQVSLPMHVVEAYLFWHAVAT